MFKKMPGVFWVGMLILYGWIFTFMIIEFHVPGFPLKKFMGIPACYIYNWIFALWLVNIFVSYLFYKVEEKREARKESLNAVKDSLATEDIPDAVRSSIEKVITTMD